MTEKQYRKADSKVLPVSLIIIMGIFLNMLGMIMSQGAGIPMYITSAACIVGALINVITYAKSKGTSKCGVIMIFATLLVCCVMVVCVDAIVYYMIAMAAVVMSMAYMSMKITIICGMTTMLTVIAKIAVLVMNDTVSAIEGGTIYITHQPCGICAKMIVNAGIKRIVVREGYPDDLSKEILDEAGLKVEQMGPKEE